MKDNKWDKIVHGFLYRWIYCDEPLLKKKVQWTRNKPSNV